MNAYGERHAFGMSRPKLNVNGVQISSYFIDRASESWHVVRNMISDLERNKGGAMRYEDLVTMCRSINCYLPDKDLDKVWSAISFGDRNGISNTGEFLKVVGGFLRGESSKESIPAFTTTNMKYTAGLSSQHPSSQSNQSEVSASLPVPHFYGVAQTDPTCMHQLTGVRYASFYQMCHSQTLHVCAVCSVLTLLYH